MILCRGCIVREEIKEDIVIKKQLNNDKSRSLSKALKEFVDIFEK